MPVILGVGAIGYSLFTDYELGLVRRIPMGTHLGLDAGSGIFLAVSPWIFGFAEFVYLPHLVLGLIEIAAALTTQNRPAIHRTVQRHGARTDEPRVRGGR